MPASTTSAHACTPHAPVQTALQQLLQACQAQADATCAAPADAIVLAGQPKQACRVIDRGDLITIRDAEGNTDQFDRKRERPASWRGSCVQWHPSYWYVYHTRTDQQGRIWTCSDGPHLVDDFGQLAPVPEVA